MARHLVVRTMGLLMVAACQGALGDAGEARPGTLASPAGGLAGTTRASLRRLTRFEYNNTVRDLLGDTTAPADALPSEEAGNGFGNDAAAQSVSSLLAEQYSSVAEAIATRATAPEVMGTLAPCAVNVAASDEEACVREVLQHFLPRAYRRPVVAAEIDELVRLYNEVRPASDIRTGLATVLEAVLQTPEFLYRPELGTSAPDASGKWRPSNYEMATRLSYFLWGTMPDEALQQAAERGELSSDEAIRAHATRMLEDDRAHAVVRFFFDNLLPIASLAQLERDRTLFPMFSPAIGSLLREETQRFLNYEIFGEGGGTWPDVFTAPYTFVNGSLADFYGMTGVTGDEFRKVPLDTTQRIGLLTQGAIVAGTVHSNGTNPVVRGSFVLNALLCQKIALPTGDLLARIKPPDPYSGKTARERFSQHSADPACAGCHQLLDPIGFALENFDAVGQWRTQENGVPIDPSGQLDLLGSDSLQGPVDLARQLGASEQVRSCFVSKWASFAYGRTLGPSEVDVALQTQAKTAFAAENYNVKKLLVALTQTDAFLFLPTE